MIKGRHKWADAIIAWAQGKPIQYRVLCISVTRMGTTTTGTWRDCSPDATPNWDHKDYEYRPKPDQSVVFMRLPRGITGIPRDGTWSVGINKDYETVKVDGPENQIFKITYENNRCVKVELAE